MWKMKLLIFLLVVVSTSCLGLRARTWKRFSPANKHFTVLVPLEATLYNHNNSSHFLFTTKRGMYIVSAYDIRARDDLEQRIQFFMIDVAKHTNTKGSHIQNERRLVVDRQVTFDGYSGREVRYDYEESVEVIRMLKTGNTLYSLSVSGYRDDRQFDQNTAKFLNSFEIR